MSWSAKANMTYTSRDRLYYTIGGLDWLQTFSMSRSVDYLSLALLLKNFPNLGLRHFADRSHTPASRFTRNLCPERRIHADHVKRVSLKWKAILQSKSPAFFSHSTSNFACTEPLQYNSSELFIFTQFARAFL